MSKAADEKEERIRVRVPVQSGYWKPNPGDELHGIYLQKEKTDFRGKTNWIYCLKTDHPNADKKGIIKLYGNIILNGYDWDELKDKEIYILYKGEGEKPKDPNKNPMKIYVVDVVLKKSDPLYEKYMMHQEGSKEEEIKGGAVLADQDDPTARTNVEVYIEMYKEKHFDEEPTEQDLYKLIALDDEMQEFEKKDVKNQIAFMVKTGEIKK